MKHCEKYNIDNFKKHELRAELVLKFRDLTQCQNNDKSIEKITKFLKENKNLIISQADKVKTMVLMEKTFYNKHLAACFSGEYFEKIKTNPTKNSLRKFRRDLNDFLSHILETEHKNFQPFQKIKCGYGLIKLHKENYELRPIVSSYNTITSNSESSLLRFLKPLESKIRYSIKSSKDLKHEMMSTLENKDLNDYELISLDAVKLYNNCDLQKIKEILLKYIFNRNGRQRLFPENKDKKLTRKAFATFFDAITTKYNDFHTNIGFFRQVKGLSMGSKLSGFFSNLFLNELEISVIPKYYKNKKLFFFARYVDDIIMVVKKDCYKEIHKQFNTYSKNLKFTVEKMQDNKINFLDITLELRESKLLMWNYSKPQNRNKITDFKHEICPKSQKIGTLTAEIFRANNTTNSFETLNKALEDLKMKFQKNNYPKPLIETKISEIKARNFQKSISRTEYEEKFKNLEYTDFQNITLPFTDLRCGKIAFEIRNLIHKICPNFMLNFSFKH